MNFIILGIRKGLEDVNIFLKTYHSENVLCSVTVGGQESDKSVYSSSRCTFNLNFHIFLFEPQHFQSSFPQIRYGAGFTFRNYHSGNTVSRTLYSTQGQNKVIQHDCFVFFLQLGPVPPSGRRT